MARQAVLRDLVPQGSGSRVRVVLRTNARIAVEGAEAHGDLGPVGPRAAEQTRPADRAERLRHPLRRAVDPDQLLTLHDAEALERHASLGEAERAGVLAAARAVAMARAAERRGHLEADAAAEAAAGQGLHVPDSTARSRPRVRCCPPWRPSSCS